MTEAEAAWLAGYLDGEGSFQVRRETKGEWKSWVPLVQVATTAPESVTRCHNLAGGKLSNRFPKDPRHRRSRVWTIQGPRLTEMLEAVIPHLVEKRLHALILLDLRRGVKRGAQAGEWGRKQATADTQESREFARLAIKALNHRGTDPVPDECNWALMTLVARIAEKAG